MNKKRNKHTVPAPLRALQIILTDAIDPGSVGQVSQAMGLLDVYLKQIKNKPAKKPQQQDQKKASRSGDNELMTLGEAVCIWAEMLWKAKPYPLLASQLAHRLQTGGFTKHSLCPPTCNDLVNTLLRQQLTLGTGRGSVGMDELGGQSGRHYPAKLLLLPQSKAKLQWEQMRRTDKGLPQVDFIYIYQETVVTHQL